MDYQAYLIHVEPPGDLYFSPEGICVVGSDQTYSVYCLDSRHNFLRAAVLKFPLVQLVNHTVQFRGAQVKLEDLASYRESRNLMFASVKELMTALYEENRMRHYYLAQYL